MLSRWTGRRRAPDAAGGVRPRGRPQRPAWRGAGSARGGYGAGVPHAYTPLTSAQPLHTPSLQHVV